MKTANDLIETALSMVRPVSLSLKYKLQHIYGGEVVTLTGTELPTIPKGWRLLTITK